MPTVHNDAELDMDAPVAQTAEGDSDYGSDFTPDEENVLNALLQQGLEDDNPNADFKIQLEDQDNDDGGQGIKIPLPSRYRDGLFQKKSTDQVSEYEETLVAKAFRDKRQVSANSQSLNGQLTQC